MSQWILLVEIAPEFSIVGAPPTAWTGSPYAYAFTALGGDGAVTWALADGTVLPAGWTLSAAGLLAHALVTGSGTFEFVVQATDASFRSVFAKVAVQKAAPPPP